MNRILLLIIGLLLGYFTYAQEQANLLGTWKNLDLIPSFGAGNIYNEIWGYSNGDNEYAIMGSTAGTHFIDVTDPTQPFEAHFVPGRDQGGVIIHRDYHDYNGYLYAVSDEGTSSLQIMDLNNIEDTIVVVYDDNELIRTAHNIFIDAENKLLYAFATKNGAGSGYALRIYSLENPTQPTYVTEHRTFDGFTVGHVHDGFVEDNMAFLNCGWDGFFIVDFTDPENPITKTKLTSYPQQGYNHSGWPSSNLDYYYMADENHGKDIKTLNICDLEDVTVSGTFNANSVESKSIPHNQVVACNYLYISYYYDGLQVYDISDPKQPVRIMEYDTYAPANDEFYRGAWGVYPFLPSGNILVSDMQTGLYVFEAIDTSCIGFGITGNFEEDCTADIPSAIEEITTLNTLANVFPTLLNQGEWFTLQVREAQINAAQLINTKGQLVQSYSELAEGNNLLLLPSKLQAGVYFLKVNAQNQTEVKRIIIQ